MSNQEKKPTRSRDFDAQVILGPDATIGDKPEKISENHFYLDEVRRDLIQIVYNRLCRQPEQTKLTAEFFGISRKTVYNYTKSSPKD